MVDDRQWTLVHSPTVPGVPLADGPFLNPGNRVVVVPLSRLEAVEVERDNLRVEIQALRQVANGLAVERDAYREGLEFYRAAAEDMARDGVVTPAEYEIAEEAATHADSVLARYPKNEDKTNNGAQA